jgi:hypothetical protein
MARFASKTDVSVEQSRAEIETTVRKYGADSFISGWAEDKAMVQFRAHGRFVKFIMTLPKREDKAFTEYTLGKHFAQVHQRAPDAAYKLYEQACRQRWRALLLLVKAKLEAVESGITEFEEEFLAHVVMPDGRTVYEMARAPIAIAYETGQVQSLLEGPKQ